jgi:hypothetical protein
VHERLWGSQSKFAATQWRVCIQTRTAKLVLEFPMLRLSVHASIDLKTILQVIVLVVLLTVT